MKKLTNKVVIDFVDGILKRSSHSAGYYLKNLKEYGVGVVTECNTKLGFSISFLNTIYDDSLLTGYKLVIKNSKLILLLDGVLIKDWEMEQEDTLHHLDINDDFVINPISEPKLFLVERGPDNPFSYDEYDSILVVCETEEQAKFTMCGSIYSDGVDCNKLVITKLADNYTKVIYRPEVPISSFNAG
jgi:hypothetical protein